MKKIISIIISIILFTFILGIVYKVEAAEVIDESTESKLVEMKEEQLKSIEDYEEKYGSRAYGVTAYVLHIVQVYSIPVCFLGIAVSFIYKVIIGGREMSNYEKGLGMMVSFITLTIICQVLPLVFAVVVKFGRE